MFVKSSTKDVEKECLDQGDNKNNSSLFPTAIYSSDDEMPTGFPDSKNHLNFFANSLKQPDNVQRMVHNKNVEISGTTAPSPSSGPRKM